jgi:broad specificity phosphatase PhoE
VETSPIHPQLTCHSGESYLDVIARLEPLIIELERHRSVTRVALLVILSLALSLALSCLLENLS